MSYTYGDLKTLLATQISDANVDTTITGNALIDTEQEIFNKYDLTLNSATQSNSVTQGTNTVASALPTNLQRIKNINITAPVGLARSLKDNYISPDDFDEQCTAFAQSNSSQLGSSPWTYYDDQTLKWGALADLTYTISIRYTKYVPILSGSTDVPTMPESFRELLLLGSKIRIYENKEDFDFAQQFQNRYADLLQDFVSRYAVRQVDRMTVAKSSRFRAIKV
jgi:hypothetical protein